MSVNGGSVRLQKINIKDGYEWFLNTELGQAILATGDNPQMITSLGVNTHHIIILGVGLSNALVPPQVLLLDEHTAALDPKTARQILDLTGSIVSKRRLTTLMFTHNMRQALQMGNRLIMPHRERLSSIFRVKRKGPLARRIWWRGFTIPKVRTRSPIVCF